MKKPRRSTNSSEVKPEETRTAVPDDVDSLSTSEFPPADLDAYLAMPADELHKEILGTFVTIGTDLIHYQGMVLVARQRMHAGEKIGGCDTWTGDGGYIDTHLRRPGEKLPTAVRRICRLLEGENPAGNRAPKTRGKSKHATKSDTGSEAVMVSVVASDDLLAIADDLAHSILKDTSANGLASLAIIKGIRNLAEKYLTARGTPWQPTPDPKETIISDHAATIAAVQP